MPTDNSLNIPALSALAVGWAAYFAVHSALASLWVKDRLRTRWPRSMHWYRLLYNGLSTLLLLPLLWYALALNGPQLWRWTGGAGWIADGLALAAVAGFVWSLRYYSGSEFLGLTQLRRHQRAAEDQEQLRISPLHRFVRHPWYSLGLVILWTRDMDAALLVSAAAVTIYLVIGSRLEERKLIQFHGDAYRRYRQRVPGLIPLPHRWLTRAQARALTDQARHT